MTDRFQPPLFRELVRSFILKRLLMRVAEHWSTYPLEAGLDMYSREIKSTRKEEPDEPR